MQWNKNQNLFENDLAAYTDLVKEYYKNTSEKAEVHHNMNVL